MTLRILLLLCLAGPALAQDAPETYIDSLMTWRAERLERLTSDTGYLAVAGFFWLQPGENTVGSAPDNVVALPPGAAPAHAGVIFVNDDNTVDLRFEASTQATIDGEPLGFRRLEYDMSGSERIHLGRLTFWVMERNGQAAVRLLDPQSPFLRDFQGLDHYPVDPAYRVTGTWEPFTEKREIPVDNYLGYSTPSEVYGAVRFELGGDTHTLIPLTSSPEDSVFFFVFADATTATETYGGGRFLYSRLQPDGTTTLDFNRAYNPPCAFNPYTTCPLPPEDNRLTVPVRAGEKDYRAGP